MVGRILQNVHVKIKCCGGFVLIFYHRKGWGMFEGRVITQCLLYIADDKLVNFSYAKFHNDEL